MGRRKILGVSPDRRLVCLVGLHDDQQIHQDPQDLSGIDCFAKVTQKSVGQDFGLGLIDAQCFVRAVTQ